MARKNPSKRKTRRGTPGGRVGHLGGALGPGRTRKRKMRASVSGVTMKRNPGKKKRKYKRNPGEGGAVATSKIFFADLIEDVLPGFVGFAATRFLTRAVAVQIEKRKPGWGKHTGAVASISSFLAAWLFAGKVKAISKWHNPLVIGSGLAALQSLLQIYVPKLGWMVGDPMPELMGAQKQLVGPQPIPDGLDELEEDPSLYQYDDRYDAGAQPQAPAGQAAAPTEEVNDIDAANLGIFDRN